MKTLTLILLTVLLVGCEKTSYLVTDKEYPDSGCICQYWYNYSDGWENTLFEDSCGKYNVGDTIR